MDFVWIIKENHVKGVSRRPIAYLIFGSSKQVKSPPAEVQPPYLISPSRNSQVSQLLDSL